MAAMRAVNTRANSTIIAALRTMVRGAVYSVVTSVALVAKDGGLRLHVDQRHAQVHQQGGEGHAVRVGAEGPDHQGDEGGAAGEEQFAAGRGGAGDRVGEDEEGAQQRSEEHTSELQSPLNLVCRLLL